MYFTNSPLPFTLADCIALIQRALEIQGCLPASLLARSYVPLILMGLYVMENMKVSVIGLFGYQDDINY